MFEVFGIFCSVCFLFAFFFWRPFLWPILVLCCFYLSNLDTGLYPFVVCRDLEMEEGLIVRLGTQWVTQVHT